MNCIPVPPTIERISLVKDGLDDSYFTANLCVSAVSDSTAHLHIPGRSPNNGGDYINASYMDVS